MMNVREEVKKYVEEMMAAVSCSKEAKAAGEKWLALADQDGLKAETRAFIKELEADIMPIDGLIAFVDSPAGAQVFGEDGVKKCLYMLMNLRIMVLSSVIVVPVLL